MKAARKLIRQITWYQQKEVSSIYHAPGIIDGYRKPGRPWTYYAKSIFQVHNETANIWSHLLGAFYCIYRTYHCCYELDFIGDAMTWPIMAFLVSATTCGICSAFAHLMHSKCDDAHYFCFLVDFLGISTFCHGSGQMSYLLGVSLPLSQAVGRWFLIFNAVICTCVMASLSAELVWCENLLMRKVLKVVPNLCAIVLGLFMPPLSRIYHCYVGISCEEGSLFTHYSAAGLAALASFVYLTHLPEVIMPGAFNVIHSHVIFHVVIGIMWKMQVDSAVQDFRNRAELLRDIFKPSIASIFGLQILVFVLGVLILCRSLVYQQSAHRKQQ